MKSHARIGAERDDGHLVRDRRRADRIVDKLVRRHPHVFGDVAVSGADEVKRNWDEIKREEKSKGPNEEGICRPGRTVPPGR